MPQVQEITNEKVRAQVKTARRLLMQSANLLARAMQDTDTLEEFDQIKTIQERLNLVRDELDALPVI